MTNLKYIFTSGTLGDDSPSSEVEATKSPAQIAARVARAQSRAGKEIEFDFSIT